MALTSAQNTIVPLPKEALATRHLALWLFAFTLLWASLSFADNDKKPLRLDPEVKAQVNVKEDEKRARAIVEGYYTALIEGRFAEAGTFIHSGTVGPIRTSLSKQLKQATPAQQTATLRELGVQNLTEFESLSTSQFFNAYARSKYGKALQVLSSPKVTTVVKIEKTTCRPEGGRCIVQFSLLITPKDEQTVVKNYQVEVIESKGRWVVGERYAPSSKGNSVRNKPRARPVQKTKDL